MQQRIKWLVDELNVFLESVHTEQEMIDMIKRTKDRLESISQINQGW